MAEQTKKTAARTYFHVGEILAAHGVQGELKARVLSSDKQRLKQLRECYLTSPDETEHVPAKIINARPVRGFWLISLQGIADREQAQKLRGSLISVERKNALTLGENEWFVADLIGCAVYDAKYGLLGQLTDILEHPAQDVYVVSLKGQKDILFPARKTIVQNVDLDLRHIKVVLPEGLYEVYRELKQL